MTLCRFARPSALLRALLTHPETITSLIQGNPTQRRMSLLPKCHQRHGQQTQFPAPGISHVNMLSLFVRMLLAVFVRQERHDRKDYENHAADKNRRLTGKVRTRTHTHTHTKAASSKISDYHCCSVFRRSRVRFSISKPATLTKVIRVVRQFVQPNAERYSLPGTSPHFFIISLPFDAI
jgi:hypothetical protein